MEVVLFRGYERNSRCVEGKSSSVEVLIDRLKFTIVSWVSTLPQFHGTPMNLIVHNWREVAIS